ncbi:MAG: CGNR zinc finger domain-containing protein [Candidatus Methylomirabilales bacterium]
MVESGPRLGRHAAHICALDYLAILHRIKSDADNYPTRLAWAHLPKTGDYDIRYPWDPILDWEVNVSRVFLFVLTPNQWWARLRRCGYPTCPHPYFLDRSKRGHKKYCSEAHRKKAERLLSR